MNNKVRIMAVTLILMLLALVIYFSIEYPICIDENKFIYLTYPLIYNIIGLGILSNIIKHRLREKYSKLIGMNNIYKDNQSFIVGTNTMFWYILMVMFFSLGILSLIAIGVFIIFVKKYELILFPLTVLTLIVSLIFLEIHYYKVIINLIKNSNNGRYNDRCQ